MTGDSLFLIGAFLILYSHNTSLRCEKICSKMGFYNCVICYQKCGDQLRFHNCTKGMCSTRYHSNRNQYYCSHYNNSYIEEESCFERCCGQGATQFTYQNFVKCEEKNKQLIHIVLISIASIMVFFLILVCILIKCGGPGNRRCCCCRCCFQDENEVYLNPSEMDNDHLIWEADKLVNWKIMNDSNTCAICLQKKVNALTKCDHGFHLECIWDWAKRQKKCPLCNQKNPNPFRFYCRHCCLSYVKIRLGPQLDYSVFMEVIQGPNCPSCKDK